MASMWLKIDGIKGEAQDSKHKDQIEIESYSWGASHASSAGHGMGASAGRVDVHAVNVTAKLDKAYPELMALVCSGDHKTEAVLSGIKMGKEAQEYLKITLSEVFCTSANVSGSAGSEVMVNYSFDCNKIKWQYAPQKNDGSLDAYVTQGWNLKENKKL